MKKVLLACLLASGLILQAPSAQAMPPVVVGLPGAKPMTWLDGETARGLIAEVAIEAMQSLGYQIEPQGTTYGRMYSDIHSGGIDMATSVLQTPERAALAHYSKPIVVEYSVIAVPKGGDFRPTRLGDLVGKRLGTRVGFKYPAIDGMDGILIDPAGDDITNARKLAAGRLDAILIGSIGSVANLRAEGLGDLDIVGAVGPVPLGVAISSGRFTDDDRVRLDAAIDSLLSAGMLQEVALELGIADLLVEHPILQP